MGIWLMRDLSSELPLKVEWTRWDITEVVVLGYMLGFAEDTVTRFHDAAVLGQRLSFECYWSLCAGS